MRLFKIEDVETLNRNEVKKLYSEYVNPGLTSILGLLNFDRTYIKAEGCYVWDAEGQRYLDFLGAYGALNLGHNPPEVLEALKTVSQRPNLLQATLNPYAAVLAHNLSMIAPEGLKHSFFCNSGTEAVEGALKTARAATGKQKIISCDGSFHGKTFGALSATGRDKYKGPFLPLVPGFERVPYGDLEALEAKLKEGNVAAFIVEPIQGEGGIVIPPKGFLKGARELCDRYGALLIVDEIQTGFGRTGRMFACEEEGVRPDIMCVAKSLGGGVMPIGAFITTEEVWNKAYSGMDKCLLHTSTFGGNTFACAAGIAAINAIVEKKLTERAAELGNYFLSRLKNLQEKFGIIKEVRGRGLMIGIEFEPPVKGFMSKITGGIINKLYEEFTGALVAGELLNKHRVITAYTLNNPNVIRLEPPLVVSKEDIDEVLSALEDIFSRYRGFMGITLNAVKTAASSLLSR
ncbi:aspartate aminotransferase family protein [Thermosediminibacter oceani]|uniref:Acetylornithine transaminase n=1 Tax=Thermosediminibacter oceani (strain ATCC BAA-1034 / DSM 16646 / JW/IW-1228P) TaxID=555079 RepID=D9S2S5_THEOJ|nr:aspartate aminotransferase family protein [Thermosediminibacter oceani]ADL07702.1 Acetylornithine transaminase [Thermosediminibacter oceani DSM 16646]